MLARPQTTKKTKTGQKWLGDVFAFVGHVYGKSVGRYSQKLHRSILLPCGQITFRFHYRKTKRQFSGFLEFWDLYESLFMDLTYLNT